LSSFAKQLLSIGEDKANIETIVKYIAAIKSEVNLSDNYRKDLIALLSRFSKYNDNKPFRDLTRSDVIAFLDTCRKTETQDPMHKWIGRMVLTYDAYSETIEDKQNKDKEVQGLKEQMLSMQEAQREILDLLKDPVKLLEMLKEN
jgi:hypothetical protein